MKIIKADEPLEVQNITLLITGQPGSGKTSMAFTSEKPLLIGFDEFIYRPANRKDAVIVNKWEDIADITQYDLSNYNTIVIDTVGMGLFYLSEYLMRINPKACKNQYTNTLSLNGWGQLKIEFSSWYKIIKYTLKKDIIFIAHEKEDKDGDNRIIRPDISGATAGEILKMVDYAGYIFAVQKGKNVIDFNTTDKYIGKNPGEAMGTEPITIPNFKDESDFLAKKIRKMKDVLNAMNKRQKQASENLMNIFKKIEILSTQDELNNYYKFLKEQKGNFTNGEAKQLKDKILERAKALNLEFDKTSGLFSIKQNVNYTFE